jgi:RecB family exonuclease
MDPRSDKSLKGNVGAEIPELPPPVDTVRVPSCFSPSNFADLLQCPLSVLHGLSDHELLPPHPRAILGTLIHKVMDRVRRSSPDSEKVAIETATTVFSELLTIEERRLNADLDTKDLVPLSRAVGRTAWRNRLAYLKAWAAAVVTQTRDYRASHTPGHSFTTSVSNIPEVMSGTIRLGTERSIVVPELRLSGRPDYLGRDPDGTIHVTDLKTGSVLDREGRPYDKYALQMRLYALMIERVEPSAKVRLWLEGAQRIEVPWDETLRAAVSAILEETTAVLPQEKKVAAETIASTGLQCWRCRIRHRCPLYLREAPDWWVRTSVARPVAPFDVWGQVLETDLNGGGAAGLEIRDAAGRRVRLRGLESRIGGNSHSGSEVWFFNLEPSENLPAHGLYAHPRNYHGTAPSRAWPDALRLKIYAGQAGGIDNARKGICNV